MTKASLLVALSKEQCDMGFLATRAETLELTLDSWTYIHKGVSGSTSKVTESARIRNEKLSKEFTLKVWFNKAPEDYFVDSEVNIRMIFT